MAVKAKSKAGGTRVGAGRNPVDKLDKVIPVTVYVKTRHRSIALAAALNAVRKYR